MPNHVKCITRFPVKEVVVNPAICDMEPKVFVELDCGGVGWEDVEFDSVNVLTDCFKDFLCINLRSITFFQERKGIFGKTRDS
jgi:hypothetical protein